MDCERCAVTTATPGISDATGERAHDDEVPNMNTLRGLQSRRQGEALACFPYFAGHDGESPLRARSDAVRLPVNIKDSR
jgi:hypothetical protein